MLSTLAWSWIYISTSPQSIINNPGGGGGGGAGRLSPATAGHFMLTLIGGSRRVLGGGRTKGECECLVRISESQPTDGIVRFRGKYCGNDCNARFAYGAETLSRSSSATTMHCLSNISELYM